MILVTIQQFKSLNCPKQEEEMFVLPQRNSRYFWQNKKKKDSTLLNEKLDTHVCTVKN